MFTELAGLFPIGLSDVSTLSGMGSRLMYSINAILIRNGLLSDGSCP